MTPAVVKYYNRVVQGFDSCLLDLAHAFLRTHSHDDTRTKKVLNPTDDGEKKPTRPRLCGKQPMETPLFPPVPLSAVFSTPALFLPPG